MSKASSTPNDQIMTGIGLILASVAAMAFGDALIKAISADLTIWQIFVIRSLFALPCLCLFAFLKSDTLKPQALRWIALRSALLVLTWILFYAALPVLDLAIAAVAVYTNPIITALLSALVLGTKVTKRQWAGVLLGFLGVLVILRPGTDQFSSFMILPLLAAAFYSAAMILTRAKCQQESALTLAFGLNTGFIAVGLFMILVLATADVEPRLAQMNSFLLGDWAPIATREWGVLAVLGVLSAAFFVGVARAYQIAPPQIIATFDYGYLVSAALWGFVLFNEALSLSILIGMILITIAGILVAGKGNKATRPL